MTLWWRHVEAWWPWALGLALAGYLWLTGSTLDPLPLVGLMDPVLPRTEAQPGFFVQVDLCSGRMHQAWDAWQMAELRRGALPTWQPFQGLGSPLWANGQSAALNPLKWLLVWAPEGPGFWVFVLARLALAWYGMRLLGHALGWPRWASDAAALVFLLSNPCLLVWTSPVFHNWACLPLLLWLVWRWGQQPTLATSLWLGLGTGLLAWVGHAEIAVLMAMGLLLSEIGRAHV